MKYCTHCGKEVLDEAVVCTGCGCEIKGINPKFCMYCGAEVGENAVICVKCGCPVKKSPVTEKKNIVTELSEKMKINGIIWLCVAGVQILLGIFVHWALLIIAALNIISGIMDLKFSKTILDKPVDIVKTIEPMTGPIVTLVYNVVVGAVIGVAGSIYYLTAIRSFVMTNKEEFLEIEASYNAQQN